MKIKNNVIYVQMIKKKIMKIMKIKKIKKIKKKK